MPKNLGFSFIVILSVLTTANCKARNSSGTSGVKAIPSGEGNSSMISATADLAKSTEVAARLTAKMGEAALNRKVEQENQSSVKNDRETAKQSVASVKEAFVVAEGHQKKVNYILSREVASLDKSILEYERKLRDMKIELEEVSAKVSEMVQFVGPKSPEQEKILGEAVKRVKDLNFQLTTLWLDIRIAEASKSDDFEAKCELRTSGFIFFREPDQKYSMLSKGSIRAKFDISVSSSASVHDRGIKSTGGVEGLQRMLSTDLSGKLVLTQAGPNGINGELLNPTVQSYFWINGKDGYFGPTSVEYDSDHTTKAVKEHPELSKFLGTNYSGVLCAESQLEPYLYCLDYREPHKVACFLGKW